MISMSPAEFDAKIAAAVQATVAGLRAAGAIRAPGSGGSAKGTGNGKVGRPAAEGLDDYRQPADKGVGKLNLISVMEIGTGWSPVRAGAPSKDDRDRRRGEALAPKVYTKAAVAMFCHGGPLAALRFNLATAPVTAPKGVLGVLTPRVSPANAAVLTPGNCAILHGLGLDPAAWLPPVEQPVAVEAVTAEAVVEQPVAEPAVVVTAEQVTDDAPPALQAESVPPAPTPAAPVHGKAGKRKP